VVLIFGTDGQPHPGMNAALVTPHDLMIQRNGCASAGGDEDVLIAGGLRDELAIYHLRAHSGAGFGLPDGASPAAIARPLYFNFAKHFFFTEHRFHLTMCLLSNAGDNMQVTADE
jgi:hypothetical protein